MQRIRRNEAAITLAQTIQIRYRCGAVKFRKEPVLLLVVALLALGLGIGAMVYHQQAKRAVAEYREQLIAGGEKLTVAELTPKPVSTQQNGANILSKAITLMNFSPDVLHSNPPSGMTMVAPGKARVGWAQPNIRSKEATNAWEDAIAAVGNLSAALTLLEELIERPNLDFNVNYNLGFNIRLPGLAQTKGAAQKLYYAALCDLHRGDTASATARLRALLAMVQGSTNERLFISQLVRMAIAAIGAVGTWELLQAPNVTDEQLASIQSDWSRLEFILAAENTLAMERAMGQMTVEQMRNSSTEFRKVVSGVSGFSWPGMAAPGGGGDWFGQVQQFGKNIWNNTRLKAKESVWRFAWSYPDQLRVLKGQQVLIECTRMARTNGNFGMALIKQAARLDKLGIQGLPLDGDYTGNAADLDFSTLFSQGVFSSTQLIDKVMKIEVSRQLVVTAVALQRYKLRHGNHPSELAALVPELLPVVPRDPVDGEALRYKSNVDGTFLLYSIGEDAEDNGGNPNHANNAKSLHWQRGRDWVWPQPATPKEVEDFYREQTK
jgi:hypothetical protein